MSSMTNSTGSNSGKLVREFNKRQKKWQGESERAVASFVGRVSRIFITFAIMLAAAAAAGGDRR